MTRLNRRGFVRFAGAAYLLNAIRPALAQRMSAVRSRGSFPIRLGAVTSVGAGQSPDDAVKTDSRSGSVLMPDKILLDRLLPLR
jgi:hypothetical protein